MLNLNVLMVSAAGAAIILDSRWAIDFTGEVLAVGSYSDPLGR